MLIFLVLLVSTGIAGLRTWQLLIDDGLHDPDNPAVEELQNPAEALSQLTYDYTGNKVNWVEALRNGEINPRTNIYPGTKVQLLDLDIIMGNTAGTGMVRFPHRQHTEWLDCVNCHDWLFFPEVDKNPINMFAILQGEYCGRCHGAVSFPLTECKRCHSVPRATYSGTLGAQYEDSTKEEVLRYLEVSKKQSALELLPNRMDPKR